MYFITMVMFFFFFSFLFPNVETNKHRTAGAQSAMIKPSGHQEPSTKIISREKVSVSPPSRVRKKQKIMEASGSYYLNFKI